MNSESCNRSPKLVPLRIRWGLRLVLGLYFDSALVSFSGGGARTSSRTASPCVSISARVSIFSSCLTFPGQWYSFMRTMASMGYNLGRFPLSQGQSEVVPASVTGKRPAEANRPLPCPHTNNPEPKQRLVIELARLLRKGPENLNAHFWASLAPWESIRADLLPF